MFKFLAFLVGFIISVSTANLAAAETKYVYSPGDGYLNLRTGPSTSNPIIEKMYNGSSVAVMAASGKWVKVRHQGGSVGWAYGSYLKRHPISNHGTQYINSPGDGYLNLRTGPSSNNQIIRKMYHGALVSVFERSGKWVKVLHASGDFGWAFSKYLVSQKPKARGASSRKSSQDCSDLLYSPSAYLILGLTCNGESGSALTRCYKRARQDLCAINNASKN